MTPRLPPLLPADLDPDQRRIYDAVTGGERTRGPSSLPITGPDGALLGPFDPMLRAPAVGAALERLGAALRYATGLPPRVREIAVLLVAARRASGFELYAHTRIGAAAGLSTAELDVLVGAGVPDLPDPVEAAAARVTLALLDRGSLDEIEYAEATVHLGVRGLVELVAVVGHYTTLAMLMATFGITPPPY